MEKENELTKWQISEAVIAEIKTKIDAIKMEGWEDTANYSLANQMHQVVKNISRKIEKRRTDLKKPILYAGRKLDDEAKKIQKKLTELENQVKEKMEVRDKELRRQEFEKQREIELVTENRISQLKELGEDPDIYCLDAEACSDEKFEKILEKAKKAKQDKDNQEQLNQAIIDRAVDPKMERVKILMETISLLDACLRIVELEDQIEELTEEEI